MVAHVGGAVIMYAPYPIRSAVQIMQAAGPLD